VAWNGKDYVELSKILFFDITEIFDQLQTDPYHQPSRRNWIRTFCSQAEAGLYSTKQLIADSAIFPFVNLSEEEVLTLREQDWTKLPDGTIQTTGRLKFPSIKENTKLVATLASKAFGFENPLETGSGWNAFLETFKVRNRLVHPKTAKDMFVSDEELETTVTASDWFQSFHTRLWQNINDGLLGRS
jgi:hypothetical protein